MRSGPPPHEAEDCTPPPRPPLPHAITEQVQIWAPLSVFAPLVHPLIHGELARIGERRQRPLSS